MSWINGSVPEDCRECQTGVEMVIVPRTVDIGGFEVHRALPFQNKRMVGPFIFWDGWVYRESLVVCSGCARIIT